MSITSIRLIKYTYNTGKHEILAKYTDIREARAAAQALVYDYILKMDGARRFLADVATPLTASKMNLNWLSPNRIRIYLSKLPYGHYIIADCHDHPDKWSVWCHTLAEIRKPGWMYGEYKSNVSAVSKIFDVDLICKYKNIHTGRISYSLTPDNWSDELEASSLRATVKLTARIKMLDVMATIRKNYDTNPDYRVQPVELTTLHPTEFSKYHLKKADTSVFNDTDGSTISDDDCTTVEELKESTCSLENSYRQEIIDEIDLPLPNLTRMPALPSIDEIQDQQYTLATAAAAAARERNARRLSHCD